MKLKKPAGLLLSGLMAFTACAQSSLINAGGAVLVPLYRAYNPNSGEHFYTSNFQEALAIYKAGWNLEGTGWASPASGDPVYRLFNPNSRDAGSHYYTANKEEASYLVKAGWKEDYNGDPVFYSGGGFPVYVQYNKNDSGHNYTVNKAENDYLKSIGWEENAVTFYAYGGGTQEGAMAHLPKYSAPARHVDVNERDVLPHGSGTYRLLYSKNDFPEKDVTWVPAGEPTFSFTGKVTASSASRLPKYTITALGPDAGMFGIGFQKLSPLVEDYFGGNMVSLLVYNFRTDASKPGEQYYVTVTGNMIHQKGENEFRIDYFDEQSVAVVYLNSQRVISLKTNIKNVHNVYACLTDLDDGKGQFNAVGPNGQNYSWTGNYGDTHIKMD